MTLKIPTSSSKQISPSKIVGGGLALLLVGVLVEMLRRRWQELPPEMFDPEWTRLSLAFGLLLASSTGIALQWKHILAALGERLSPTETLYIHFLSQTGKYIPGKVMLIVGKVVLAVRQGLPTQTVTASVIYEQVLLILSGGLVVLLFASMAGVDLVDQHRPAVLMLSVLGLVGIHPTIMARLLRVLQHLTRSKVRVPELSYRTTLRLLAGYALPWCVLGLSFYFFVTSFVPLPGRFIPDMSVVVIFSGLLGLVSILTPAGLGVREAVITAMLSAYFPLAVSLAIPLAFRIAVTAADLVALLLGLSLRPYCQRLALEAKKV